MTTNEQGCHIVKNVPNDYAFFSIKSGKKVFIAYRVGFSIMIGIDKTAHNSKEQTHFLFYPVAELTQTFEIKGIIDNSGDDRFEMLSPNEKSDVAILVKRLANRDIEPEDELYFQT